MKRILAFLASSMAALNASAEPIIAPFISPDHSWVKGVYWSPGALPGWGFFVDLQEDLFFGAVYGYEGPDATFITLQGRRTSDDPPRFEGDVFLSTQGGSAIEDVGNFTWTADYLIAGPAARLTISSNILNRSNFFLQRFRYREQDEVDVVSGGTWNIVRRSLITFGDHYRITDERVVGENGFASVAVFDLESDEVGVIRYFPPEEGEGFAMLLPFSDDTDVFYVFVANEMTMLGRYWFVDEGDSPSGDGLYFRGHAESFHVQNEPFLEASTRPKKLMAQSKQQQEWTEAARLLERAQVSSADLRLHGMFTEDFVTSAFHSLKSSLRGVDKTADAMNH